MARPTIDKYTQLTAAELEIMQILWDLDGGTVNDIISRIPEPKPAYNTVSTVSRVLVEKEFLDISAAGRSHCYVPLIDKEAYADSEVGNMLSRYFDNSFSNLVSFFARKEKFSESEIEDMVKLLKNK